MYGDRRMPYNHSMTRIPPSKKSANVPASTQRFFGQPTVILAVVVAMAIGAARALESFVGLFCLAHARSDLPLVRRFEEEAPHESDASHPVKAAAD